MPKILINEKDRTTPGTPNGYANFSVLVPGFTARTPVLIADVNTALELDPTSTLKADVVQPDSNGIYEFNSVQDFIDVIGLVAPKTTVTVKGQVDEATKAITQELYHYGNQIAYELLNQGYSIVYIPITPENCVDKLTNANTWEIFKDKASYDFRFITHGLLQSSDVSDIESEKSIIRNAFENLNNKNVLDYEKDSSVFSIIDEKGNDIKVNFDHITNEDLERKYDIEEAYQELYNELTATDAQLTVNGLRDTDGSYYTTGGAAIKSLLARMQLLNQASGVSVTTNTINTVNANIANLATYIPAGSSDSTFNDFDVKGLTGRGDCIALIEIDEKLYANHTTNPELAIVTATRSMSGINKINGQYCATTVPSVVYEMTVRDEFKGNKKFPGAFHYLTCFMSSLQAGFAEWYAAAGYTRGVSSYKIKYTTVTLGELAINVLEPRKSSDSESEPSFACNVIANFRGSYYLWGNRTAHPVDNKDLIARHFLNIRQLSTTVKKQLFVACRRITFDPNSDSLWFNFVSAIRPTLDAMKADQGIRDYKILKVPTDRKATLKAKIRIIPIEAVEDFDIEVSLEDSFGETVVTAD